MGKPAVLFRSMLVFHVGRDSNDCTGGEAHSFLALFLIPALAGGADQQLSAAALGVVDMPMIPASGLKGNIGQKYRALTRFC